MSGGLSIHCVDVARGRVAVGLRVALRRLDGGVPAGPWLCEGVVGDNGLFQHPVGFVPLDVDDEALPAGVVLVGGRIQTVLLQMLYLGGRGHGTFLIHCAGDARLVHCNMIRQAN